jgi:Protein of unknown function (DUF1552)
MSIQSSRRVFLRGIGASIALPALASFPRIGTLASEVSNASSLATTASGAPLRSAFLFFPNGAIPKAWWPESTGTDFAMSPTLSPLQAVRDKVQIMKGLDNVVAEAGQDGGGDHARGNGTFLTSVRINKSSTAIRAGVSIDQVIANRIGGLTRFPSLELASDPRRQSTGCDSGYSCAYQFNISWKSATTPMATEHNPRMVFERLFGVGAPGERAENLKRRREEQRSILDYVLEDARSMRKRIASEDFRKIDEYLSGVRSLESQIQRAEKLGDARDPGTATPVGVPQSHEEYVEIMFELMALAFQTDSTRVASLMLGHDGDNRSYDFLGISEGHHDLTHHQDREDRISKVQQIDQWYAKQFAKLLTRLDSMHDSDGQSVLHNSMVLIGSGNADGNAHTHKDLPILLAGSGGGKLNPGRFVNCESVPLANLYLKIAETMGITDVKEFGDSTGVLSEV